MAGSLCEGLGRRKRQPRIGRRPLSGFSSTCVSRRRYSRRPPAGSTRQARLAGWPWPGRIAPGTARRARASSPRRRIRRGYRILEVHDSPVPGVPDTGEKQWVSPGCRSTDRPVAGSVVRWFGSSHQPASAGPGDDYWEYCPWLFVGEESARLCGRGFIDLLPDEVNRKAVSFRLLWNIGKFPQESGEKTLAKSAQAEISPASRRASAGTSEAGSRRRRKRVCRMSSSSSTSRSWRCSVSPLPARWPNSPSARVRRRSPSVMAAFRPWRNTLCGWVEVYQLRGM